MAGPGGVFCTAPRQYGQFREIAGISFEQYGQLSISTFWDMKKEG